jgi:hypothetical protein
LRVRAHSDGRFREDGGQFGIPGHEKTGDVGIAVITYQVCIIRIDGLLGIPGVRPAEQRAVCFGCGLNVFFLRQDVRRQEYRFAVLRDFYFRGFDGGVPGCERYGIGFGLRVGI